MPTYYVVRQSSQIVVPGKERFHTELASRPLVPAALGRFEILMVIGIYTG